MTIRRPTSRDLRRLAEANHFDITDSEMAAFEAMIPGLFESYDILEQLPEPRTPLRYPGRDAGVRPNPEEDPYKRNPATLCAAGRHWRQGWRASASG